MNSELYKADADRLLAYRNLLAAEDHLDELAGSAIDSEEALFLEGNKFYTIWVRDHVMPTEKDARYHCLVKHYATAYEAMREVYKVSKSDSDKELMEACQTLLNDCLEKLWQRQIIRCERCGVKEDGERRIDQSLGGGLNNGTATERPRWTVSGSSSDRGAILSASEECGEGGQGSERSGSETEEGSFGDILN